MSSNNALQNSIESSGFPLGFMVKDGNRDFFANTEDQDFTVRVEARMLSGHQKEAVVTEGIGGPVWRMTSDEGLHLHGTDCAPFPLGFFNAGLQSDLLSRLCALLNESGTNPASLTMSLSNTYAMQGSFALGTGKGFAYPPKVFATLDTAPDKHDSRRIRTLLEQAVSRSSACAALKTELHNTFALYANGSRKKDTALAQSPNTDIPDPYFTHSKPPAPIASGTDQNAGIPCIEKTDRVETGHPEPMPTNAEEKFKFAVDGKSSLSPLHRERRLINTQTWLQMKAASHFILRSDNSPEQPLAPCGLGYLSAAIAFCYLTQLSRYIEQMKLKIDQPRMVQNMTWIRRNGITEVSPVDTHLFLNGLEPEEAYSGLMQVAANTCYLHAALGQQLRLDIR